MRSLPIAAPMFAFGIVMTPAAAQSPAEFYKGKTITIISSWASLGACWGFWFRSQTTMIISCNRRANFLTHFCC
jgi:hypothetical protein